MSGRMQRTSERQRRHTAYAMVTGFFTSLIMEAGPTVRSEISNAKAGRGVIESGKYQELMDNALMLDPKTEAYRTAKGIQDGSIHANDYNVGALLRAYVDVTGEAAFMRDMSQIMKTPVSTAERFVDMLSRLNQNAKASPAVTDAISNYITTMQDLGDAIPANVQDAVMEAYRTFEADGTNNNALTVIQTALQSIDSAIMQGLQSGTDVTGLLTLRSQMESGLSGSIQKGIFASKAVNTKVMADAVTTLLKLPADVQAAIDIDALSQAYYDYLTAGKKGKTEAEAKAVDALFTKKR